MRYPLIVSLLLCASFAGCMAERAPLQVTYTATDYSFAGPNELTGDTVSLQLENKGTEVHHVAIARIDAPHTMEELRQELASGTAESDIPWAHWVGGAGPFMPTAKGTAHLGLAPGSYVMLCFVPDANGVPHYMLGMMKQVVVHASTGAAPALPPADITVTESDFAYTIDPPMTTGSHTVLVKNVGAQAHEAIFVLLNPGATADQFLAAFGPNATGPPPGSFIGGLSPQDAGMQGGFTADFVSGHYLVVCFVSDPGSHAPHFALGMMHEFTIA